MMMKSAISIIIIGVIQMSVGAYSGLFVPIRAHLAKEGWQSLHITSLFLAFGGFFTLIAGIRTLKPEQHSSETKH